MRLRIASWNINSVRLRLPLVERFLLDHAPDVLCLQEIKCASEAFPREALAALGYKHAVVHGQPGYHGVATIAKVPLTEIERRDFNGTSEARHLSVRIKSGRKSDGPVVDNFYVPSGGDEPDVAANPKFKQKLDFLAAMAGWAKELDSGPRIAVGDLNVAPGEHDVWSHKQLLGIVSHTPVEVDGLNLVIGHGAWTDVMRAFVPPTEKLYSWWSYRAKDWRAATRGRRLDHIWARGSIAGKATGVRVIDVETEGTGHDRHEIGGYRGRGANGPDAGAHDQGRAWLRGCSGH
jgi:exodeoxyribonuclease-3